MAEMEPQKAPYVDYCAFQKGEKGIQVSLGQGTRVRIDGSRLQASEFGWWDFGFLGCC